MLLSTSVPLVSLFHFLMSMFGAVDCCLRAWHFSLSTVIAQGIGTATLQCSGSSGVLVLTARITFRHIVGRPQNDMSVLKK